MSRVRKLGRTTPIRKAMLRSLATELVSHGKLVTTEARAKETKKVVEPLIALACKEMDNFETVTVKAKVAKKDKDGKRVKEEVNGKKKAVYDLVDKQIKKDKPSRLNARRKMMSILYGVSVFENPKKKKSKKSVDLIEKLFTEYGPKYKDRKGGYTRIIKIGQRKGDQAMEVLLEFV